MENLDKLDTDLRYRSYNSHHTSPLGFAIAVVIYVIVHATWHFLCRNKGDDVVIVEDHHAPLIEEHHSEHHSD